MRFLETPNTRFYHLATDRDPFRPLCRAFEPTADYLVGERSHGRRRCRNCYEYARFMHIAVPPRAAWELAP